MLKIAATAFVLALFVSPAMAKFWVVKDAATQKCSVVEADQKPTPSAGKTVFGTGYQTRDAAENVMTETMVACGATY